MCCLAQATSHTNREHSGVHSCYLWVWQDISSHTSHGIALPDRPALRVMQLMTSMGQLKFNGAHLCHRGRIRDTATPPRAATWRSPRCIACGKQQGRRRSRAGCPPCCTACKHLHCHLCPSPRLPPPRAPHLPSYPCPPAFHKPTAASTTAMKLAEAINATSKSVTYRKD